MNQPTRKPKFGGAIPLRPTENDTATQFVIAAPGKNTYPWQETQVRADLTVQLNTRVPEDLALMIEWISYNTKESKREFTERALRALVAETFAKLNLPLS
jgi:hypothetical protein